MAIKHSLVSLAAKHPVHKWEHANAAARAAESVVATDLGAVSWQKDNDTFWVLIATTPTWAQLLWSSSGALTQGSVPFADSAGLLAQDNAKLYWDDTAKVLAVGTNDTDGTPDVGTLTVKGDTNDGSTYPLVLRDSGEANILYVDSNGVLSLVGGCVAFDNQAIVLGNTTPSEISHNTQQTNDSVVLGLADAHQSFIITKYSNTNKDHDLGAQGNPGVFIFSTTDPDSDNSQYGHLYHSTSDFVINQGRGATKFAGAVKHKISIISSGTYSANATDRIMHVTYTGTGTVDITLPDSFASEGRQFVVFDAGGNASGNRIRVQRQTTATINGATYLDIVTDYGALDIYGEAGNWFAR